MIGRSLRLGCLCLVAAVGNGSEMPSGEHPLAPAFSLTDIAGNPLNLSDYKGKVVLLDFWATWCEPCRSEVPKLTSLVQRYHQQDLAVIGVSLDDNAESVRRFAGEYKLNYPIALGKEEVYQAYGGIFSLPTAFLIGRDGRIYAKHFGAVDLSVLELEIRQLLAGQAGREVADFQSGGKPKVREASSETASPQEVASDVPGVNLTRLTAPQKQAFKRQLEAQRCTCGCQQSVFGCRRNDLQCKFSLRIARKQMAEFAGPRP